MADLIKEGELELPHIFHALAIGIIAGFVIVLVDNYLLTKVEKAVGLATVAA